MDKIVERFTKFFLKNEEGYAKVFYGRGVVNTYVWQYQQSELSPGVA
jgi:hypothetical protein